MIEFIIVLLSKRCFENKISPMKIDTKTKHSLKIGSKRTNVYKKDIQLVGEENGNDGIHENRHNNYLRNRHKRALFNSLFEPKASEQQKLVEKGTRYKSDLDIASAIIFPISYLFFNIIYWYCIM